MSFFPLSLIVFLSMSFSSLSPFHLLPHLLLSHSSQNSYVDFIMLILFTSNKQAYLFRHVSNKQNVYSAPTTSMICLSTLLKHPAQALLHTSLMNRQQQQTLPLKGFQRHLTLRPYHHPQQL